MVEVEVPGDTVIEEVEVQVGGDLVPLVARCKASPPFENGRCDNLTRAVGAANAALAEAGDDRRSRTDPGRAQLKDACAGPRRASFRGA